MPTVCPGASNLLFFGLENRMRKVGLYLFAAFWLILMILFPSRTNISPRPEDHASASDEGLYKASLTRAPFGLLGVNFYESTAGKKRWNIKSKFAELYRKDNHAFMQDVTADFFADKTKNMVRTVSKYGRSLMDKNLVELEGEVAITSRRGYLFEMDRLNYDGKAHQFSTDDLVRMKGPSVSKPSMFLKGTGFIGNIDSEHFSLKKNVTAQRQLRNTEWMKVSSVAGEFYTEEQRAIFIGKVNSSLPKITIQSDYLEVGVEKDRESIEARGNVTLRQKEKTGRAEKAFLEVGSSRIVLEGNARVDSRGNEINGRRIILYSDDDRVEVEGASGKVQQ